MTQDEQAEEQAHNILRAMESAKARRMVIVMRYLLGIALVLLALDLAHAAETYPIDRVHRIIDGDTLVADLSLGLGTLARRTVRLKDVCAQEMWEVGGPMATVILEAALSTRRQLSLEVTGTTYGRLEGILWHQGENVNALVQSRLVAAEVNGGRGWCP